MHKAFAFLLADCNRRCGITPSPENFFVYCILYAPTPFSDTSGKQEQTVSLCKNSPESELSGEFALRYCKYRVRETIYYLNYSTIAVTTPEPTVLPPSRIAKRSPSSIAIGVISSTSITTLSPGLHISVSAGRVMFPVTSVVLK